MIHIQGTARANPSRHDGLRPSHQILELGVGTGRTVAHYPADAEITAVDLSTRMLARARARALSLGRLVHFAAADAQHLPFAEASFDTVIASFLFCSVPDPVLGLSEAPAACSSGPARSSSSRHVLSERPLPRALMRAADPLTTRLWGAHLDRDTVTNVRLAGFKDVQATRRALDIVCRIEARGT